MNGLEFCARIGLGPSMLGLCGKKDSSKILNDYLTNKDIDNLTLMNHLSEFKTMQPFLKLISENFNLDIYDYKVVEAYWIGNELIDKINHNGLKKIYDNNQENLPTHLYYVFYTFLNKEGINIKHANLCAPLVYKVKEINETEILAEYNPIIKDNFLMLGNVQTKNLRYNKSFLPSLSVNDYVLVHWNMPCIKLTKNQKINHEKYLHKTLKLLNSFISSSSNF